MELNWSMRLWNVLLVKVDQLKQLIVVDYTLNPIKTEGKTLIMLTSPRQKQKFNTHSDCDSFNAAVNHVTAVKFAECSV